MTRVSNHTVRDFVKGERVIYTGYADDRPATVVRPVKTRGVVHIEFDGDSPANYRQFDAYPHNLQKLANETGEQ